MSFASCHFRTQKSLDFQGPPLPNALVTDLLSSRGGALRSLFTFIAVADVIAAVGFPNWVLAMVSAIAGVLGAVVVYTAVDIPGVPTVSAAAPIAGEVLSPAGFLNVSVMLLHNVAAHNINVTGRACYLT